ncbi:hypothetical protein H0194_07725 [Corynebacterium incognita]|uniref:Uncharacterized protein n=1 Tax=Corynebacterium incognita TaxID=2754725 RepID=A0A7G7CN00_9CORY|nr:hypothetical protein [Corynebacterium incognita]QNE88966.1 hypothetical protein H0194_07725 [Corynebacterium incognita]
MQLTTLSKNIVIGVIAAFVAVMGLLVAVAAVAPEPAVKGTLTSTLEDIEDSGLHATAVAPADVYGDKWVAGAFVCPGMDANYVKQALQLDPAQVGLREGQTVEKTKNFLVLRDQEGGAYVEELSRFDVDLCTSPVEGYFDTHVLLAMLKTEADNWALAIQ